MYIYNVSVKVETHKADEWLAWMKQKHIPDVMATGFFTEYRMSRLLDDGDLDGITFVMQYVCNTLDDYLNYKTQFAPALQKEHSEKFASDVVAFRTVMEIL
ncbi:MAG: DUF4286 family protein [Fimbriimonadaceae bacterium]|nr:DUF4286 family protein [Chitinophagales bacterium]